MSCFRTGSGNARVRRTVAAFAAVGLAASTCAHAQYAGPASPGVRPAAVVTTGAHYQRFALEESGHIEEISFPVYAAVPVGPSTSVSLRVSPASAGGRGHESLAGLSDVQLTAGHAGTIGSGSFVVSLGLNLPSGKRSLSSDEFETTVQLSQNFYDFRTPTFGQGFNASPGITWAVPIRENLVLGLGATYQYKGGFQPLEEMDEEYRPGSELLLTGGLDLRVGPAAALSGDVTYTRYGTDRIGTEDVFEAGDQVLATTQFLMHRGFDELRLVARYRNRGRGTLVAAGIPNGSALRTLPNQLDLLGSYRMRTSTSTAISFFSGVHYYDGTDVFSSRLLLSLGVGPERAISEQVGLWTRFSSRLGDFTGLEVAAGLRFEI